MLASIGNLFHGLVGLITIPAAPSSDPGSAITSLDAVNNQLANTAGDKLGIGPHVAMPLLNGFEMLIPAAVALAGLHKLMQHQETGGSFLVDMLVKGGGSVLIIQLVKSVSGLA